jgi:hypothetical protein
MESARAPADAEESQWEEIRSAAGFLAVEVDGSLSELTWLALFLLERA